MAPVWLIVPVMVLVIAVNLGVAVSGLRRIRESGAWAWAGMGLGSAFLGVAVLFRRAPAPPSAKEFAASITHAATIAAIAIFCGLLAAVAIVRVVRKNLHPLESPRFATTRAFALGGMGMMSLIIVSIDDPAFELAVTIVLAMALVLGAVTAWEFARTPDEDTPD